MKKAGVQVEYQIGTMIELPRAALTADKIAEEAEFFSFGTNDLTQMTFGFSRDDIKGFMPTYLRDKILPVDPFQSIDVGGVGQLIEIGIKKGRDSRKAKHNQHLKVGICGEHGGDPDSVHFCHKVGMDYVSCSPFRVPIARLAAAQAALGKRRKATDRSSRGHIVSGANCLAPEDSSAKPVGEKSSEIGILQGPTDSGMGGYDPSS